MNVLFADDVALFTTDKIVFKLTKLAYTIT